MADAFELLVRKAESRNRGWVYAGDIPPCVVRINGTEHAMVTGVHRRKGKAVVMIADDAGDLVPDKHKKRLLTKTVYGEVEIEAKGCGL